MVGKQRPSLSSLFQLHDCEGMLHYIRCPPRLWTWWRMETGSFMADTRHSSTGLTMQWWDAERWVRSLGRQETEPSVLLLFDSSWSPFSNFPGFPCRRDFCGPPRGSPSTTTTVVMICLLSKLDDGGLHSSLSFLWTLSFDLSCSPKNTCACGMSWTHSVEAYMFQGLMEEIEGVSRWAVKVPIGRYRLPVCGGHGIRCRPLQSIYEGAFAAMLKRTWYTLRKKICLYPVFIFIFHSSSSLPAHK